MSKMNKTYCTECPYFTDVIYEDEGWYGARCKKDGHSTEPSMYAIESLHNDCPLATEIESQESEQHESTYYR